MTSTLKAVRISTSLLSSLLLSSVALPLAASATASPETATVVSPTSGSDVVLAVRGGTEGELRLNYRKESEGEPTENLTAGLARDYSYVETDRQAGPGLSIIDYRLRRVFNVRPGNVFVNDSLYATVWWRVSELQNRAWIAGAMNKAGVSEKAPATSSPFWSESELGMTSPKLLPRPALRRVVEPGRSRWLLDETEVAAVRYRAMSVPDEVKPGLRKFWLTVAHVHPQIAEDLTTSAEVPEELWIKTLVHGHKAFETFETWHWVLTGARWVAEAKYPLPPGLPASPTTSQGSFPEIFATLSSAVAQRLTPPSDDAYIARSEAAISHNAGLEAVLWNIEMRLADGTQTSQCAANDTRPVCSLSARAGPPAKSDPRTAVAFDQRSPDLTVRSQFESLPNAYMLRLLWATRPPGSGVDFAQNERGVLAALEASPVANFCKDTGDLYARAWQPLAAWQAYDLGRQMAGHRSGDLLDSIDALEARLAADMPREF
jgi:hypothetical protein